MSEIHSSHFHLLHLPLHLTHHLFISLFISPCISASSLSLYLTLHPSSWPGGYPIQLPPWLGSFGQKSNPPPSWGTPLSPGWGTPPAGVPPVPWGTPPLAGVPPWQSSIACTCYAAVGMPLAFMQENFLVYLLS